MLAAEPVGFVGPVALAEEFGVDLALAFWLVGVFEVLVAKLVGPVVVAVEDGGVVEADDVEVDGGLVACVVGVEGVEGDVVPVMVAGAA